MTSLVQHGSTSPEKRRPINTMINGSNGDDAYSSTSLLLTIELIPHPGDGEFRFVSHSSVQLQ